MIGELTPFSAIHHGALFDKARGQENVREVPGQNPQTQDAQAQNVAQQAARVTPVARQEADDEGGSRNRQERSSDPGEERADERASELRDKRELLELKRRDREVRRRIAEQRRAAGKYGASIRFAYEVGPDGKQYAVDGDVQLDTTAQANRKATVEKMVTVRKAALAADRPTPDDQRVAAEARRRIAGARMFMREELRDELREAKRPDVADLTGESEEAKQAREEIMRELMPEQLAEQQPQRAAAAYAQQAPDAPPVESDVDPALRAEANSLLFIV